MSAPEHNPTPPETDFDISWDDEDLSPAPVCRMEEGCISCEG